MCLWGSLNVMVKQQHTFVASPSTCTAPLFVTGTLVIIYILKRPMLASLLLSAIKYLTVLISIVFVINSYTLLVLF